MINILKTRNGPLVRSGVMAFPVIALLAIFNLTAGAQLPHGTSYIPSKTFTALSPQGKDSIASYTPRIVSIRGFYMKRTEVTNKEYREFTNYVRDSIAHSLLQHYKTGNQDLDWSSKINWTNGRLSSMMISPDVNLTGKPQLDPGQLKFGLTMYGKQESISIYPDTLVWMKDFSYSFNDPLVKNYFSNPKYDDYPVVGINLLQAMAFCQWKTTQLTKGMKSKEWVVRLPTNYEWEAAALEHSGETKPVLARDYDCNFGPITDNNFIIKNYDDDGYFYTSPVKKYPAGPYGLYDMKGNVAEWTSSLSSDIVDPGAVPAPHEFIAKGGGWDSSPFYLQPGACRFFDKQAAHSFLGFRYVVELPAKK